jgi:hypothetical protein
MKAKVTRSMTLKPKVFTFFSLFNEKGYLYTLAVLFLVTSIVGIVVMGYITGQIVMGKETIKVPQYLLIVFLLVFNISK